MTRLPQAAVKALARGVPADKVLMPNIDLTPKQKQFVRAMVEGKSKRDAYLDTYDASATSASVSSTASRIAAKPKIVASLQQQQAVERLRYSQNPLQIREFVVDSLQHEAKTAQKPADRLRALELLGRLADVGAFETRSVITHQRSDSRDALRAKLARLAAIDVEATETPTVPPPPQTDRLAGGATLSTNPHQQSIKYCDPQPELGLCKHTGGYEDGDEEVKGEESVDTTPLEEEVGSHRKGGKKKDRPIWEDPKRWYKEVLGELPKPIEEMPLEEARRLIQEKLK